MKLTFEGDPDDKEIRAIFTRKGLKLEIQLPEPERHYYVGPDDTLSLWWCGVRGCVDSLTKQLPENKQQWGTFNSIWDYGKHYVIMHLDLDDILYNLKESLLPK